ncbi:mitoguardin [Trichonephila inaurata madagascariensis]|uniref:Mitoguardin n=1 Tax=Trichonephila inaurata madagascariensis TaxID=2747483 RepID=A0A8X6X1L7_9ARAC|nr:mitoguardin [Trichonephila inaurata madagascariensis]
MDIRLRLPVRFLPVSLSKQAKITFITVTVGITLLGFVARLLRRRRRSRPKSADKLAVKSRNQNYSTTANGGKKNLCMY